MAEFTDEQASVLCRCGDATPLCSARRRFGRLLLVCRRCGRVLIDHAGGSRPEQPQRR